MPFAPNSFDSPSEQLSGVSTGMSVSVPSRLHVPLERKAASPPFRLGTAAEAHCVSWPATAMTFAPPGRLPVTVPLGTGSPRMLSGMPKSFNTRLLHFPDAGSSIWLVEAILRSQAACPHKKYSKRSGIKRSLSAFCSNSGCCLFSAVNWNNVFIGIIWLPVSLYSSSFDMIFPICSGIPSVRVSR